MKITGASSSPLIKNDLLPQKVISTLLEIIKPLDTKTLLVNSKLLGEITLSIKEPLEASALYHATLIKNKTGFTLSEAFKLPMELKKLLALKPLMSLEQLINQLSEGKSPKKIALESLTSLLSQAHDKEEAKEILSQLLQLTQTQEAIIPLLYHSDQGYVQFKKTIQEEETFKLPFEAYFQNLGIISGFVSFFKQKREAHLKVLTEVSKEKLLSHAKSLPMELFVSTDKKISIEPSIALLDVQA